MVDEYKPQEIEGKWQQKWAEDGLYRVGEDDSRPKWYALTMFPYTSGNLHIGHWYAMAPADVHARFKRMQGYNVLHPMGFDAFGLPAENAAIKHGIHPYTWTMQNVDNMRRQLKSIGAIYDWSREVITCLPEYYKWTQWFFLKLYEAGLAYRGQAPVNWCPRCQTVLANEQVVDGSCERCDTAVARRDLEQWFFRITRYADELKEHDGIDWPERIKMMQRNWVGRSEGTEISFSLDHPGVEEKEIRVFTTRADTVFGVTFMVLAPEHPLVEKLTSPQKRAEVAEYIARSRKQSEIERLSTEREKDGVFIGAHVINRLNGEPVPIWIADYVLMGYGTGAVMAVPAHDERDFAFAKKYNLPIRVVIAPPGWQGEDLEAAYIEPGVMVGSAQFDGLPGETGSGAVSDFLEEKGWGKRTVRYRIRDWLISRQRYWGAPIPMVYCPECGIVPVSEGDLPVLRYNHGTVPPPPEIVEHFEKKQKPPFYYARGDYIHPVYGPDGEELTDDYSMNHPHHRGICWAWPVVRWQGEARDIWAVRVLATEPGGVWARPVSIDRVESGPVLAVIEAENVWRWGDREEIVRERVAIRAFGRRDRCRFLDVEIRLVALVDELSLGGRPQAGYGGFTFRTFPEFDRRNIEMRIDPSTASPRRAWFHLTGNFPGGRGPAGVVLLEHVTNPDYPSYPDPQTSDGVAGKYPKWRTVQPAWPGDREVSLAKGAALVLKHRLWIHPGARDDEVLSDVWATYAEPVATSVGRK